MNKMEELPPFIEAPLVIKNIPIFDSEREAFIWALLYYFNRVPPQSAIRPDESQITQLVLIRYPLLEQALNEFFEVGGFGRPPNRRPLDEVVDNIKRIMDTLPPGKFRNPFIWLSTIRSIPTWHFGPRYMRYSDIDLLIALGYPLTQDILRLILQRRLTLQEWKSLLDLGLDICGDCPQPTTDSRETSCTDGLLSKFFRDIISEWSSPGTLVKTEDLRQYLETLNLPERVASLACQQNPQLETGLQQVIQELQAKISKYRQDVPDASSHIAVRARDRVIEHMNLIMDYIREALDILHTMRPRREALGELTYLPSQGRFPGGYQTIQRQPGFLNVRDEVMRLTHSYQSGYDVWNDTIQLAGKTGILPFSNKQEALEVITQRVSEMLEDIQQSQNMYSIVSYSQLLNIPLPSDFKEAKRILEEGFIEWSERVTLQTDWQTILEVCKSLGITSVPSDVQDLLVYLQQYTSQL